jgi:hypothetical protein
MWLCCGLDRNEHTLDMDGGSRIVQSRYWIMDISKQDLYSKTCLSTVHG